MPTARRSTSSFRRASRTAPRSASPARARRARAAAATRIVTIEIAPHRFFTRDGNNIRLDLPVTLKEAVLGAKVKVPTPEGPVMLTIPKGTHVGQGAAAQGPRLHRPRTASAATSWSMSRSTCPPATRSCRSSPRAGTAAATRGRALGFSAAVECGTISPQSPEARRKRLASMRAAFGTEVEEKLKPQRDGVGSGQARRRRRLQRRLHPRRQPRLSVDRSRCFPSSSSPPRSRTCSARARTRRLTVANVLRRLPPDVAATLREPIQEVLTVAHRQPCCGSERSSACGPRPASSRRSATSCAAPMA